MTPKTHPIDDDDTKASRSDTVSAVSALEPPEGKRQTSGDSHETVEESGPGQEPLPPPSPSSPHELIQTSLFSETAVAPPLTGPMLVSEEGPTTTSLQRHQTVDEEMNHFKRLMQRCRTEESDSQPGAHHVEGPHLDILVEDEDGESPVEEDGEERRRSAEQMPGDEDSHELNSPEEEDPFAEPYNVPSAYLVADEELGESTPPSTDLVCVAASDLVPTVTMSSSGVEEGDRGDGPTKKKDEKNKSGCTTKVPCCEVRLTTPFLVAIAIVGIIVAIIVIVLGAKYANGGEGNADGVTSVPGAPIDDTIDIPIVPDELVVVDPITDDPEEDNRPVVDIGDIDFSKDGGDGDDNLEPEQPPTGPDPHEELTDLPDDAIPEVLTDCNWQKLLAVDGEPDKRFGQHVAIDGDILAIGAAKDNEGRGSVYVYELSDVSMCCWSIWYQPPQDFKWKYSTKLSAPDGEPGDTFTFVDISKNTIAVGAKKADVDGKEDSGAAYVWIREDDNGWFLEQKLSPEDLNEGDLFSNNLTLEGDRLIVTARLHDGLQTDAGSAYFFRRKNGKWKLEQKLMPDDLRPSDEFGSRAVIQGDRALISAYRADGISQNSGVVYVYKYSDDEKEWHQEARLAPNDGIPHAFFGINLAIDGDTILVGAYNDTEKGVTEDGEGAGAAYVYSLSSSGEWIQTAKILAADGEPGHNFGRQVALNGNVMIVSSLANYLLPNSGALYIFRRTSEGNWEQQSKLMTKHAVEDSFGSDISLDGLTILAGARYDTDNGYRSGSAYIIDLC